MVTRFCLYAKHLAPIRKISSTVHKISSTVRKIKLTAAWTAGWHVVSGVMATV